MRGERHMIAATRSRLAAARAFYCDALGGRQLTTTRGEDGSGSLRFRVGEDLVTTGPGAGAGRVAIVVRDAIAVAERCWDAGFEVRVRGSEEATTIAVVDPFELELELVSAASQSRLSATLGCVATER